MRSLRTLGIIAALLILVGAVVVVTVPLQSSGWFAYAPLADDVYVPPGSFSVPAYFTGRQLLGLLAIVLGLVLAALAVGIRIGRRQIR